MLSAALQGHVLLRLLYRKHDWIWIHWLLLNTTHKGRYYRHSQGHVLKSPHLPLDAMNHYTLWTMLCYLLDCSCTTTANIRFCIWRQKHIVTAFCLFVIDCIFLFLQCFSNIQLFNLRCLAHSPPSSVIISCACEYKKINLCIFK